MANSQRRRELHSAELGLVLDREMGKVQWSGGVMESWILGIVVQNNILIYLD